MANVFYTLHVGISGVDDTWAIVEAPITVASDTNGMI